MLPLPLPVMVHVEPPVWRKWINGVPWTEGVTVSAYTSDTITVTEVIYTEPDVPNVVVEGWDADRLELVGWLETGGIVRPEPDLGGFERELPAAPDMQVYTLTKWFHVRPCTWTDTVLWEELWVDGVELEQRLVTVEKPGIEMAIDSFFDVFVGDFILAGEEVTFQLQYTNSTNSDFEGGAWIRNTFPLEAPFAWSNPAPSDSGADGSWAMWDLPLLDPGAGGLITVAVDHHRDLGRHLQPRR